MLKINPSLEFVDKISVSPNSNFEVPFNLTIPSSIVSLKEIKITLLGNTFQNKSTLSYYIPFSSTTLTGSFSLFSGTTQQTTLLKGIEVEYILSNQDMNKQSPGKIKQIFGPISIDVTNNPVQINNNAYFSSLPNVNTLSGQYLKTSTNQNSIGIELQKSYSKISNIAIGDFITVNIDLTSFKAISDQYLFIKDTIPSGFTVDEESLKQNQDLSSYSLNGDSLTLFLSALSQNKTIPITYKIQAKSTILASIAPAASISSMYNENSMVFSKSFVLGNNLLKRNFNGIVQRDLILPSLSELTYKIQDNKQINFEVSANDTDGIGQVTLFYKDQNWNCRDLVESSVGKYVGSIQASHGGKIKVYVQVQDINGNNFESDVVTIQIPVVVIEGALIIGVLFITGIIGVTGYTYAKKKLLRKKNE